MTASSLLVETAGIAEGKLNADGTGYHLFTIGVPDMDGTDGGPVENILPGARVTVTFLNRTGSPGITNPAAGGPQQVGVSTSDIQSLAFGAAGENALSSSASPFSISTPEPTPAQTRTHA